DHMVNGREERDNRRLQYSRLIVRGGRGRAISMTNSLRGTFADLLALKFLWAVALLGAYALAAPMQTHEIYLILSQDLSQRALQIVAAVAFLVASFLYLAHFGGRLFGF